MSKSIRVQSAVFPDRSECPIAWFALTRLSKKGYDGSTWPEDRRQFEKRLR